jgi:hypothetical protein
MRENLFEGMNQGERMEGNLFDGFGDLGTDGIAGEKSGSDRSGDGREGSLICEIAASECSSEDLRSHT